MVIRKILVTGGAGFIGSHLCEELVKNSSNKVYSLDNYFTGREENHINNVKRSILVNKGIIIDTKTKETI